MPNAIAKASKHELKCAWDTFWPKPTACQEEWRRRVVERGEERRKVETKPRN